MVKRRLGDEGECVRLLLLNRRRFWRPVLVSRFRGTVHELRSGGTVGGAVRPDPLTQRLSCRRDSLNEHSTRLRLQPRADDHHTVVVVIYMQGAVFVPARRLLDFHLAIHPAPAADDTFNVLSRAGQAHLEQTLLDLGRGDPRQRSDLGVRQLTARQRLSQPRQRAE